MTDKVREVIPMELHKDDHNGKNFRWIVDETKQWVRLETYGTGVYGQRRFVEYECDTHKYFGWASMSPERARRDAMDLCSFVYDVTVDPIVRDAFPLSYVPRLMLELMYELSDYYGVHPKEYNAIEHLKLTRSDGS